MVLLFYPDFGPHSKDLAEIRELEQDRKCWRGLTLQIEKAAEVSQTEDWDAKRL